MDFPPQPAFDELAKIDYSSLFVIPVNTGIQYFQVVLDTGLRRSDSAGDFLRHLHICFDLLIATC